MKKFFCCCLLAVVASVTVSAQITDSLGKVCLVPAAREGGFARYIDRRPSTKGYRMTFIAVPLIVGGAVMSVYDTDFRRLRNGYVKSFHHDYDDYLQYAPAAVMLGLKAFGVKGRSSWGRHARLGCVLGGADGRSGQFAEIFVPCDASRRLYPQFVSLGAYGHGFHDGDDAPQGVRAPQPVVQHRGLYRGDGHRRYAPAQ